MPQIGEIGRNKNYMKSMWMACPDCGHEHWVRLYKGKPQSVGRCRPCSSRINQKLMERHGSNNGRWKSGRTILQGGYIGINVTPDDFFYSMCRKTHGHYVAEHRLVMAKHLGRCLLPWEVVHHKNGIRDDNRLENLELLPTSRQHIPSIKWQREINKRDKKIAQLEARIKEIEGAQDDTKM
jgi:hypothetical protein